VGPGTGQLTNEILLKKPKKIILIEKDLELSEKLIVKYKNNQIFKIYNQDVLKFDFKSYKNIILISNLPYNISVKILYKLIRFRKNFDKIIVMLQKEVAEKLNDKKNKKVNKHNFIINTFYNFDIMFNVSNNVFYPKPKVKSCVVKIIPKKNVNIDLEKLLFFSNKIFLYKRKKISNILKNYGMNNIDNNILNMRTEDISREILLKIFKKF
jgi:Dimethyladenosine transferase (rRNA methylation)